MHSTLVCICSILYTQYIGVYLFYTGFGYCFCLQFTAWVYNPFWSPISIGVSNALGITVNAYIFTHGNGLFVTVIYITCHHLHLANALSRSHNSLFRLFFTYRNYLAVPLIRPLWGCLFNFSFFRPCNFPTLISLCMRLALSSNICCCIVHFFALNHAPQEAYCWPWKPF